MSLHYECKKGDSKSTINNSDRNYCDKGTSTDIRPGKSSRQKVYEIQWDDGSSSESSYKDFYLFKDGDDDEEEVEDEEEN
jgi:hypothetical protein